MVIMAAGRGTRMRGLAGQKPKHLIEVSGRPFLSYLLDNLVAAGATELILVIGHQAPAAYEFAARSKHKVHVVNQFERLGEGVYGTLLPLKAAALELIGKKVAVVNGDNYYTVSDLTATLGARGSAVAVLPHVEPWRFGVAVVRSDGSLEKIIEKSATPPTNLVNTGLYRFSSDIWNMLDEVMVSPRGEYELTDAVNLLAMREVVSLVSLQGPWLDLGRPEDIEQAEALVKKQNI